MRLSLALLVAALAVGIGAAVYATGALDRLEHSTVDTRFTVRGNEPPPSNVVVVGIDDRTFDDLGLRWPFPRRFHARLIDQLRRAGARVIGYDVQFTEASDPRDDQALFDSVQRAGNVVLATTEVGPRGSTNIFGGDDNVRAARALAGNANFHPDAGGVVRRVTYSLQDLKTFSVGLLQRASGRRVLPQAFPRGGAWIDFPGPPRTVPTYSFSAVLQGRVPRQALAGKVVIVGAVAPSLHDQQPTPTAAVMSGPEIQADAVWTLARDFPLRSAAGWVNVLLIALLGCLPVLLGLFLRGIPTVVAAVLVLVLYAIAVQLSFNHGRILALTQPVLAWLVATGGTLAVHYFTEVRERHRTRAAFARYVPPEVVDVVLAQATDGLRLGGRDMEATLLFSDIRGFTTFSEDTPANRVIEVLNRYLSEMTQAVMDHGGVVISYMGDGIMAMFGAPIEHADHADRALATAREMLEVRLPRFNEWLVEQGLAPFAIGVGINTGRVMVGNVGSEKRLEFTAIGDAVNTAARLESMTKGTPYPIFLSGATCEQLRDSSACGLVGDLAIRGRATAVRVWGYPKPVTEATAAAEPTEMGAPA